MTIWYEPFLLLAMPIHLQMKIETVTCPDFRTLVTEPWWNLTCMEGLGSTSQLCDVSVLTASDKNAAALKSFTSLLNMGLIEQQCDSVRLFQSFTIFIGSLKHFQKNRSILHKATELCWLLKNLYDMNWTKLYAFISSTPVISKLFCDEMVKFLKLYQRRLLLC